MSPPEGGGSTLNTVQHTSPRELTKNCVSFDQHCTQVQCSNFFSCILLILASPICKPQRCNKWTIPYTYLSLPIWFLVRLWECDAVLKQISATWRSSSDHIIWHKKHTNSCNYENCNKCIHVCCMWLKGIWNKCYNMLQYICVKSLELQSWSKVTHNDFLVVL